LTAVRYLLDTNILIAMSKESPGLAARLADVPASSILLSSVVVAEIEYGIAKSARREHNRRVFDILLEGFRAVPFDTHAAKCYGPIRAQLEQRGELIGPYDLMIAGHARALDAVLVTDNVGEFTRVEGLAVENWLA
jgi:tRNA(fMet)-specific endonuclease VapC